MELTASQIEALTHRELAEHLRLAKVNPGHYATVGALLQQEADRRSPIKAYRCAKCGHAKCELGGIRTAGSGLSAFFDVQSAKYIAVVCERCAYTEFYQGRVSAGEQAIDFAFGS